VICAVSLVGQWVDEAKRLCDNQLTIHPYHGSNRIRDPAKLAQYDIVVTTYGKSFTLYTPNIAMYMCWLLALLLLIGSSTFATATVFQLF
jgi:replicative superfamily II helicase